MSKAPVHIFHLLPYRGQKACAFVCLRVHNLCIRCVVLMYSAVQVAITVLRQAYSTLSFTLKWPHAATTVVPHRAFAASDNTGGLLPRVRTLFARARDRVCLHMRVY